jgi:hypothetical protein
MLIQVKRQSTVHLYKHTHICVSMTPFLVNQKIKMLIFLYILWHLYAHISYLSIYYILLFA